MMRPNRVYLVMETDFYANLTPLARFTDITEPRSFTPLPESWHVLISDVRGSTRAIAEGRYKDVNMIGAASIVAVLNRAGAAELPFVFGGDGATLAVPEPLLSQATTALLGVQAVARREFAMDLRVGVVPMRDILAAGREVRVGKLTISEQYEQAIFSGGGLAYAEQLIKGAETAAAYSLEGAEESMEADLSGLECRWQDIPSRYGETICLLVMAAPDLEPARVAEVYRETIATIQSIYGDERDYHPLAIEAMKASYDPRRLLTETKLRSKPGLLSRLGYLSRIWALSLLVTIYPQYGSGGGKPAWWDRYREIVFQSADYKKYDDTLRMIIAGKPEQRRHLEQTLEARYAAGELVYGIHVTNRALMTCLVFQRMGRQVHFVDGADGGYALAAKAMKARLADYARAKLRI